MKQKWIIGSVLCLALLGIAVAAVQQARAPEEALTAKLQQTFLEASQAYDANRPAEAVALYSKLADAGYESKELFFNLGNAYFKMGKIGSAVLNYRRAWQIAPRDPDIQANLRFALQSTTATLPEYSTATKLFFKLSESEWITLATLVYWMASVLLATILLMRIRHLTLFRALAILLALLFLSVAGIVNHSIAQRSPEWVVMEPRQQALYAPLEGSKAFFALPEGSIVRMEEQSGTWLKISTGQQSGYVPSKTCARVDVR